MITQTQIDTIWRSQNIHATRNEVKNILEAFDLLNTQADKAPLEVAAGQKVFVRNTDSGDDEEFTSLKEAQEYLLSLTEDCNWEPEYFEEYITVIVGREVSIEAKKTFSLQFS